MPKGHYERKPTLPDSSALEARIAALERRLAEMQAAFDKGYFPTPQAPSA
jgi:hypothetical protein